MTRSNFANFVYVPTPASMRRPGTVVIRDVGPWDRHQTVTNAPEGVVKFILDELPDTKRIFYYDSEGELDELVFENGEFTGFRAGPREARITNEECDLEPEERERNLEG